MNFSKDLPKDLQRVIDDALATWGESAKGGLGRSLLAGDLTVYGFPQLWGSTALGHGGIGGQAMTTAQTWVVFSPWSAARVYFGGRLAYGVPHPSEDFMHLMRNAQMPGRCDKAIKALDKNGEIVYPEPQEFKPPKDFIFTVEKVTMHVKPCPSCTSISGEHFAWCDRKPQRRLRRKPQRRLRRKPQRRLRRKPK